MKTAENQQILLAYLAEVSPNGLIPSEAIIRDGSHEQYVTIAGQDLSVAWVRLMRDSFIGVIDMAIKKPGVESQVLRREAYWIIKTLSGLLQGR